MKDNVIFVGDGIEVLKKIPDWSESIGLGESRLHVISDPPYEMDMDALATDSLAACPGDGNVILFSYPGDVPRNADEYHIWLKPESTKNFVRKCGSFVESISIFRRSVYNGKDMHWSQLTGVHRDRLVLKTIHPYQKPLTLMQRLVMLYTNPDDFVFDPFSGSGTTLLAAASLGRRWAGCEVDPERAAVIAKRMISEGHPCTIV